MKADSARSFEVVIPGGVSSLPGSLVLPEHAVGIVLFAHGSGSSRHSPRNQFVASVLQEAGFATLLFDLLSGPEGQDRRNVFDIPLLADRLIAAMRWARANPRTSGLPIGLFGASTGAAAAVVAAAGEPAVKAVVSRGGRPDLAGASLGLVRAPTLLIVGGEDAEVLELNRWAQAQMQGCVNRVAIVPGASHLFEEPGTLEQAAELARDWFTAYLGEGGSS